MVLAIGCFHLNPEERSDAQRQQRAVLQLPAVRAFGQVDVLQLRFAGVMPDLAVVPWCRQHNTAGFIVAIISVGFALAHPGRPLQVLLGLVVVGATGVFLHLDGREILFNHRLQQFDDVVDMLFAQHRGPCWALR